MRVLNEWVSISKLFFKKRRNTKSINFFFSKTAMQNLFLSPFKLWLACTFFRYFHLNNILFSSSPSWCCYATLWPWQVHKVGSWSQMGRHGQTRSRRIIFQMLAGKVNHLPTKPSILTNKWRSQTSIWRNAVEDNREKTRKKICAILHKSFFLSNHVKLTKVNAFFSEVKTVYVIYLYISYRLSHNAMGWNGILFQQKISRFLKHHFQALI